jgi:hypothetical protein
MAIPELHACFGFELLGMCKYDPQAPSPASFTIGDAVAALAFTLAVQQFLKPIYRFRLLAMGIRFSHLVSAVFVGAVFTVFAAAVPNIGLLQGTPLGYALNWEIAGGLIIGIAYAVVAGISLRPARVTKRNIEVFTWAGTELLSQATDEDRLSFAKDVFSGSNIQKLFSFAARHDRAEWHAIMVEFEKLREQGREGEGVKGQPPTSAFYDFAHRHELELASYAWHFLQILSDRDFCRVVITRHPWGFLRTINSLTELDSHTRAANSFIQAVAWQALVQDEGMLAREDGYEGFGQSRDFANEFFGNHKMRAFDPLGGISAIGVGKPSVGFVSRLNIAAALMVSTELKHRGFWDSSSLMRVARIYESICHSVSYERSENKNPAYLYQLCKGVTELSKIIATILEESDPRTYNMLFAENLEGYRHDSVGGIARLVAECLKCFSSNFQGIDDPAWSSAWQVWNDLFRPFGDVPVGLSPLQQAVAVKLIEELQQNMNGYYPTLSRVLLAMIGPYDTNAPEKAGSAAAILKEAVYFELKRLPKLNEESPEKVLERLPPNVTYQHAKKTLTHRYSNGMLAKTKLTSLQISKVDLLAEMNLRRRS